MSTSNRTVEHTLACIIESAMYDRGDATSVCVSIVKDAIAGTVKAQLVAWSISGAPKPTLQEAIESLYDVMVERAHKDRVRSLGLLARLDAAPKGGAER